MNRVRDIMADPDILLVSEDVSVGSFSSEENLLNCSTSTTSAGTLRVTQLVRQ